MGRDLVLRRDGGQCHGGKPSVDRILASSTSQKLSGGLLPARNQSRNSVHFALSTRTTTLQQARRFSVAPMMDWTDRHCRYLHRLLTTRALLFTEMVTSAAIVHGDRERLLGFRDVEHPVAVQLGGSDAAELAEATRIATAF